MEFIFFLVLLYFVAGPLLRMLGGASQARSDKTGKPRTHASTTQAQDWSFGVPKSGIEISRARKRLHTKDRREHRRAALADVDPPTARDPADKNRSRRNDWGAKAGPEIFSGRNLIILTGVALIVFYVHMLIA